jgi:caffeoyl-CoA O-methyltransferase
VSFIVEPGVEAYAEAHSTPPVELFQRLAEETRATQSSPQMMVGQIEGFFLSELVRLSGARHVLELGTFTGYSSISMALALPEDGRVITCDINEETSAIARRYAEEAGVANRIDYRVGPALDTIATLDGPFDIVFIDADKPNYVAYYDATLPLLAADGVMIVDNTLWSGKVAESADSDENTNAIRALNERVRNDDRVENVLLTVRDGMNVIRRRR